MTGGSTQGGSTITQQYVKNAFLTSDQTFSRKFQELFLAIKLDNNYSKEQILENYLNTIYFGRGAYGIEAAANTYFGVPAAKLTAQQGAVLAVLIRSPSRYDPAANPNDAADRWGKVLDAMVAGGLAGQGRPRRLHVSAGQGEGRDHTAHAGRPGGARREARGRRAGGQGLRPSSRSTPVVSGSPRPWTSTPRTSPSPR